MSSKAFPALLLLLLLVLLLVLMVLTLALLFVRILDNRVTLEEDARAIILIIMIVIKSS